MSAAPIPQTHEHYCCCYCCCYCFFFTISSLYFFLKFIHLFGYPSRNCVIKSVFMFTMFGSSSDRVLLTVYPGEVAELK